MEIRIGKGKLDNDLTLNTTRRWRRKEDSKEILTSVGGKAGVLQSHKSLPRDCPRKLENEEGVVGKNQD